MRKLLILFILTGCTTLWSYEPKLAAAPKNQNKYQSDLKACRDYVWDVNQTSMGEALSSGAGVVGNLTYNALSDEKKPTGTSFSQVDNCMAKKGYKVAN